MNAQVDGKGQGHAKTLTMIFSLMCSRMLVLELVPKLRFVQLSSSGSDLWANHPKYLDKNVVFCTTSGSNAQVSPPTITP